MTKYEIRAERHYYCRVTGATRVEKLQPFWVEASSEAQARLDVRDILGDDHSITAKCRVTLQEQV